jgi:two-component system, NarL family, nitrate/nitrite response regulator NarL
MRSEAMATVPIRVVHIDDQLLFRAGIHSLLGCGHGIKVVGDAGNRTEALAVVRGEQPDVILLDLSFQGDSGLDLIPQIISHAGKARILILTAIREADLHRRAIRLGAKGIISKDASVEVLAKAIEKVHAGEVWLDRTTTAAVFDELFRKNESRKPGSEEAKIESLTEREREVISAVGEGMKNRQIGKRLFISDVTVRHHLTSIYSKLQVTDRLELIIYAYRHGLVPIPR